MFICARCKLWINNKILYHMIQKDQDPFAMFHFHHQIASYCHMLLDILHGSVGVRSEMFHSDFQPIDRKVLFEVKFVQLVKKVKNEKILIGCH